GMQCTGTYSGVYHLDTSYLLRPVLAVQTLYHGMHLYLWFDTRKEDIVIGGKLALAFNGDTTLNRPFINLTITPALSNADSANWVTHQIDLTNYVDTPMFYVAFRYTSGTTSGTAWYIDNVRLSSI